MNAFVNSFLIGMFLGYSILQLLEYGVAVMTAPIKRFYDYLHGRIDQERQAVSHRNGDTQDDVVNITYHHKEINLDEKGMARNSADLKQEIKAIKQAMEGEVKVMKQEMVELNEKMERYANATIQIKERLVDGRKH